MAKKLRVHAADMRGINRLTIDGIAGLVDLVEAMHYSVASVPGLIAKPKRDRTTGITRLVYRSIRGAIGLVGHALNGLLAGLAPWLGERSTFPGREALLAALNGVLGDYLAASHPVAAALERSPMMRRADEDELVETPQPIWSCSADKKSTRRSSAGWLLRVDSAD